MIVDREEGMEEGKRERERGASELSRVVQSSCSVPQRLSSCHAPSLFAGQEGGLCFD